MDPEFWHARWAANEIGFHEGEPNTLLVSHFDTLALPRGSRVFVPLCGKTRDIHWLLSQGVQVVGVELSELAVSQLFEDLSLEPRIETHGALKHYAAKGIDIFAGDIFHLDPATLGTVDAIYDRAALVALPEAMRSDYRSHLQSLCPGAAQLLLTLEYEKGLIPGPPFSIPTEDVHAHFGDAYDIRPLDSRYSAKGLKDAYPVTERAWHLR